MFLFRRMVDISCGVCSTDMTNILNVEKDSTNQHISSSKQEWISGFGQDFVQQQNDSYVLVASTQRWKNAHFSKILTESCIFPFHSLLFLSHWNCVCVCQRKNCNPHFKEGLLHILKEKNGYSQFASPICVSTVKFVFHTSIPLFCSVLSRESVTDVAHISVNASPIFNGSRQ